MHTKLPWSANFTIIDGVKAGFEIVGPENGSVHPVCESSFSSSLSEIEDNAALIVKAVNCHDVLVSSLSTAVGLARIQYGNIDPDIWKFFEDCSALIERVKPEPLFPKAKS